MFHNIKEKDFVRQCVKPSAEQETQLPTVFEKLGSWAWRHLPVGLTLKQLMGEDFHGFKTRLDYTVRPCFTKMNDRKGLSPLLNCGELLVMQCTTNPVEMCDPSHLTAEI